MWCGQARAARTLCIYTYARVPQNPITLTHVSTQYPFHFTSRQIAKLSLHKQTEHNTTCDSISPHHILYPWTHPPTAQHICSGSKHIKHTKAGSGDVIAHGRCGLDGRCLPVVKRHLQRTHKSSATLSLYYTQSSEPQLIKGTGCCLLYTRKGVCVMPVKNTG